MGQNYIGIFSWWYLHLYFERVNLWSIAGGYPLYDLTVLFFRGLSPGNQFDFFDNSLFKILNKNNFR